MAWGIRQPADPDKAARNQETVRELVAKNLTAAEQRALQAEAREVAKAREETAGL
jgi:hypothetical protein